MPARYPSFVRLLLAPAVGLMLRLRYAYKFAAIGLLGLIAIAYLFIVLTATLQQAIDTARQEQAGLAVEQPLLALIQVLQQHEGLAAAVQGGVAALETQRADRMAIISQATLDLDHAIATHGARLHLGSSWPYIKDQIDTLRRNAQGMSAQQSRDAHATLLANLLAIMAKVNESSQLALDPVASSYYLMDAATNKLPAALISVGRLRAHGAQVLAAHGIDAEARTTFVGELAVLQLRREEAGAVLRLAQQANPQMAGRISSFGRQFDEAIGEVREIVNNDIAGASFGTDAARYLIMTTAAIDRGYDQTLSLLLPLLNELLAARIEEMQMQRFRSALLAGPAFLLLFMYLAAGACLAVMSSIRSLRDGAERMANGDFLTPIELPARDELRHVATSFNHMGAQLSRRDQEAHQHADELKTLNRQLETLSTTDGLTGIANRRHFDAVLASEWSRAARLQQPLALAMIDVDWFKQYNDHYGHLEGDECLRQVALVLASCVRRAGDLAARYGGEEFAFIAPNCDAQQARQLAVKIQQAFAEMMLPHQRSEFGRVTVSVGLASLVPQPGDTPHCLVREADQALYQAKEQGRNRAICQPGHRQVTELTG
jgi:diguanylate cyclase (GGDEF)-like protein